MAAGTTYSFDLVGLLRYACVVLCVPLLWSQDKTATETQPDSASKDATWVFRPPLKRRDIFYDLEEIYSAENALAASQRERNEPTGSDIDQSFVEVDTIDEAIQQAGILLQKTETAIGGRRWVEAMQTADNGIALLTRLSDEQGRDQRVRDLLDRLTRYRVQAEDAKLYEEAKAEFTGLGLSVQGIMWSADQPSSAIISGEAHGLQDRVKNCLIVNIDTNRVDFMYVYKRRQYEFQRYIGDSK